MSLEEKVKTSIERIQRFADIADTYSPDGKAGYYLAFSGGKDSIVTKRLLDMAGVKYDAHYRVTSVDPPDLVRFIKEYHPDVERVIPRDDDGQPITMWNLIPKKLMPPTRLARYCCQHLKETGGIDRFVITGVRWAESTARRRNQGIVTLLMEKRKALEEFSESSNFRQTEKGGIVLVNDNDEAREEIEACPTLNKMLLNPIIDWTDADVWGFIRREKIPYCTLYDEGFHRLGCIGCPMAPRREREQQFFRWPKYKAAYLRAFQKLLDSREEKGFENGKMGGTPETIYRWWLGYAELPGQIDLLEDL